MVWFGHVQQTLVCMICPFMSLIELFMLIQMHFHPFPLLGWFHVDIFFPFLIVGTFDIKLELFMNTKYEDIKITVYLIQIWYLILMAQITVYHPHAL